MMFKSQFLGRIRASEITRTYRRWKRPQVKLGGTYQLMRGGAIEVIGIQATVAKNITDNGALRAGFQSAKEMLAYLDANSTEGDLNCIRFRYLGDVKKELPDQGALKDKSEWLVLDSKLEKKDRNSKVGVWTKNTLCVVAENPGMPSVKLAPLLKREQMDLKKDMRKLKQLGLTVSLEAGYKLSDRGESYLELSAKYGKLLGSRSV
ncbi:MAG: ASCH domain-containing protein [bacterium]|nr:ASCH domain-containing protein [Gammaproteobacteria bacterium]HIL94541.1 ASCH domain-containing protein [Pseudomonadales bacterium]